MPDTGRHQRFLHHTAPMTVWFLLPAGEPGKKKAIQHLYERKTMGRSITPPTKKTMNRKTEPDGLCRKSELVSIR